jgi:DNA-binding transcriptional MerR regulator
MVHNYRMQSSLGIGDFARATHLSVKTLRHYHETGILVPVEIDAQTGYRRYGTDQIAIAQVIRRFRALDMPLEEIRTVLAAQDIGARNTLISAHLGRLENSLARTQSAVASLRGLLQPSAWASASIEQRSVDAGLLQPSAWASASIEQRSVDATMAAAITQIVDVKDALFWYRGAVAELYATLAAQHVLVTGGGGGHLLECLVLGCTRGSKYLCTMWHDGAPNGPSTVARGASNRISHHRACRIAHRY